VRHKFVIVKDMITIEHQANKNQFIALIDGKEAHLKYNISAKDVLDYYSTFVPPELRGQHIAQNIVKFALDYAKDNHFKVIPSCPFVKKYIDQHAEYQALIAKP